MHRISHYLLPLACAALFPAALHAQDPNAQPPKDEKKPEEQKPEEKKPAPEEGRESVTQREITLGGNKIAYTATAGVLTLKKLYGEPRADVFHISYVKKDAGDIAKRPVCFCFNGGPGSSSVWLHLGAFGPKRVVLPEDGTQYPRPPYQLTDNEASLLADSDLVFVDPVSTGLSRAEKGENPNQFHGYNEDVESMGDFIRLWITKNGRWASPKFLMGESYGVIRTAGLAGHLQERYGMFLNGIIFVSGLLDFQTLDPSPQNDVPFVIYLPAVTACAFHHRKLAPELLANFDDTMRQVREFARGPYAAALHRGAALDPAEREKIATELARFTSLPKDLILRAELRITPTEFRRRLLEAEDDVIGRFDGRVRGDSGDPSMAVVQGAFSSAMNSYLRAEDGLKFPTERPYEILGGPAMTPWNYSSFTNRYLDVSATLSEAMTDNPALRIFVACGYFDLATPPEGIEYSLNHMPLDPKLRGNISYTWYHGGHMMYTNLPEMKRLGEDTAKFVRGWEAK